MTDNFSAAVAAICLPSLLRRLPRTPRAQEATFTGHVGILNTLNAAPRSKTSNCGSKASTLFVKRNATQHNTTNGFPRPQPRKAPAVVTQTVRQGRLRKTAMTTACRQKSRAAGSPESPACLPYRTPSESDQSWGSRCCFHGDWMHRRGSSHDPPGSSGLPALMDDSSGMRES